MILVTLAVDRDYTVVDNRIFLYGILLTLLKPMAFVLFYHLCTISRIKTILDTKSICFQCFSCNNVDKFVSL